MITCVFKEILNYNTYKLTNKTGETELIFEFYDVQKPNVGDKILIHEDLLNKSSKEFSQPYAFTINKEFSARKINDLNNKEFIVLRLNNKNYVLKRIYG